ncbi:MAG: MBOAT family protein [Oscillospiraceae bacterium]|nr:MBOAT family protein [Oscillospiraceae bacterium]
MVFSSLPFLFGFFALTLAVYYAVPKKFRNFVLLIFSLFFYGYGEPVFILLMLFSILVNYGCGLLLGKLADKRKKARAVLIFCVVINLALLGYFKYAGLFVSTLKYLPVFSFLPNPEIALPIGISFYTFQTMSYVIDVYKGNCKPQKNIVSFGTFVSLFPQLIAGPIVRYVDVESQLSERRESMALFSNGVRLFTLGLAKKVLIANEMGIIWNELKFAGNGAGVFGHWIGILAFTLQIYFDFSGYSDMARGLGNMFGFRFVKNFDYPYISKSITEFWRRWHISLGTWFREYVYIPLGGNRKGKGRQCLNIFIVWALTGFWHGASWNFLLWGVYFGVLLTVEKFFTLKLLSKIPSVFSHIYTMFFVIIGWVIFDFSSVADILKYVGGMFGFNSAGTSKDLLSLIISYLPVLCIAVFASLPVIRKIYFKLSKIKFFPVIEACAVVAILTLCTSSLVRSGYNPFLYFRF